MKRRTHSLLKSWFKHLSSTALAVALISPLIPTTGKVQAQCTTTNAVCGSPSQAGRDGAGGVLSGVVNRYYPGTTTTLNPNTVNTTISLGTSRGGGPEISAGDHLLIIQMQDATIDTRNDGRYGGTNGNANGGAGNGSTALGSSGLYEYVRAVSVVTGGGGAVTSVTIAGVGTNSGLCNTYNNAAATGTRGQRRYQVIRVPQYRTASLSNTLTASPWDGTSGGVLALDIYDQLNLNGATVSVNGLGFRGGAGRQLTGDGGPANDDFVSLATDTAMASKGEGIAGTPRYVHNATANTVVDTGVEGYPGGSYSRGAPGNAGGGGNDGNPTANDENSGGGGGSNCGVGGVGGNSWDSNLAIGGRPGFGYSADLSVARVFMGGGGGAGTTNNGSEISSTPCVEADTDGIMSSGAAGGGIVMIRAGRVTGTGTINADGASRPRTENNTQTSVGKVGRDGGGGGGGGGSVIVIVGQGAILNNAGTGGALTVTARGGNGGDAWPCATGTGGTTGDRHGPGGGGGGGTIYLSTAATSTSTAGGSNGITTTANSTYGGAAGSASAAGCTSTTIPRRSIPGVGAGFECPGPLYVAMKYVDAVSYPEGTLLSWGTGFEVNNLGFQVYRDIDGRREPVTDSIISGTALMGGAETPFTAGKRYQWVDDITAPGKDVTYWIEEIDLGGFRRMYGPLTPIQGKGRLTKAFKSKLLSQLGRTAIEKQFVEYAGVANRIQANQTADEPESLRVQQQLAGLPALKLGVKQTGWYRLTFQDLAGTGFNLSGDPRKWNLYANGVSQPILVSGEEDGRFDATDSIEFLGRALDTFSTDTQVYWLASTDDKANRIQIVPRGPELPNSAKPAESFPSTIERRERSVYFSALLNGDGNNFFGAPIVVSPVDLDLAVANPVKSGNEVRLTVAMQGVTRNDHRVLVSLNGSPVGTVLFEGQTAAEQTFKVQPELVRAGRNVVTLTNLLGQTSISLTDRVSLTYQREYVAVNNRLECSVQSAQPVVIEGFTTAQVAAYDITDPADIRRLTVRSQGGLVSVTGFRPNARLLVLAAGGKDATPEMNLNRPSNLAGGENQGDFLIISHKNFIGAVEPLAALRRSQGRTPAVVDLEDVYDEFSFGNKSPQAIKDFLAAARTWKTVPRHVLLVGDATFDSRNYLGTGDFDFVPTKLIDTDVLETASDDWFVDFNSDSLPELAIGRLPVRTLVEAQGIVGKIVSTGSVRLDSALMIADNNDVFDFEGELAKVAESLPATVPVSRVLRGLTDVAAVRQDIFSKLNAGPALVDYIGHGSVEVWGNEDLFTTADAARLTNAKPAIVLGMHCLNGFFQDVYTDSLAKALLRNRTGGAIAVWASSGLTRADDQAEMHRAAVKGLFGGPTTIGEALVRAKAAATNPDVRRTWILFGDPSTPVR